MISEPCWSNDCRALFLSCFSYEDPDFLQTSELAEIRLKHALFFVTQPHNQHPLMPQVPCRTIGKESLR